MRRYTRISLGLMVAVLGGCGGGNGGDDAPPPAELAVSADTAQQLEGDDGTRLFAFTVTRSGDPEVAVTADFQVTGSGGAAADAADFGGSLPQGSVQFAAGELSRRIDIAVSGDADEEPDEGFTLTLANAVGGLIAAASASATIANDDAGLHLESAAVQQDEGDDGVTAFTFTVTRSGYLDAPASVDYSVAGGGEHPADNADFGGAFPAGTLEFPAGAASRSLMVEVHAETDFENDEGFTVTLSNAQGARLHGNVVEALIRNDDAGITSCDEFVPPVGTLPKQVVQPLELECYLKAALLASIGVSFGNETEFSAPAPSISYSTTNLQEAGVDEADRLKSDGSIMYLLTERGSGAGSEVRVMQVSEDPAAASELLRFSIGSEAYAGGLYLTAEEQLISVGDQANAGSYPHSWYDPWAWHDGATEVTFTDVSVPTAPVAGAVLALDGYLVASRRIGDKLYLVTRFTPPIASPTTDTLADVQLPDMLPRWRLNGIDQGLLYEAGQCALLPVEEESALRPNLLAITAVDVTAPANPPLTACLTGPSETVYASLDAIYAASSPRDYLIEFLGPPIAIYQDDAETAVHKFALTEGGPQYRGSATVPGHLGDRVDYKPYRMGEHEGVLRVVTTVPAAGWGSETQLTLLREGNGTLEVVSRLPNEARPAAIGKPGEDLYAARFVGERGFLVTFRKIDPLYVVDLSDPADPFLAGEVEISGYSDYLHPVDENRVLGIGKETVPGNDAPASEGGFAWYQGVKLSLFDVSDPAAPREVDAVVVGQRGTEADILTDSHALAWLPATDERPGRLALPISLADRAPTYGSGPSTTYSWTHDGLHLFEIVGDDIVERGAVVSASAVAGDARSYSSQDRALIAGEAVHYVYGDSVWSAAWNEPENARGPQ